MPIQLSTPIVKKHRDPVPLARLKALARNNPSPEVQELLWEIKRMQGVMLECKSYVELVRAEWYKGMHCRMVAMESLRVLLIDETMLFDVPKAKPADKLEGDK